MTLAFQDYYPDEVSYCYGCGRLNEHGLQIKSYWDGAETVCHYQPRPYHTAVPGYVYGGLIASLIDCHGTGTAAAAAYRDQGRSMDSDPPLRFLTASRRLPEADAHRPAAGVARPGQGDQGAQGHRRRRSLRPRRTLRPRRGGDGAGAG